MAHTPAAVRRAQIIRAATTVIARDGVAGATTRRIAAEAGLSLATLHYVFSTKDEILAAVLASLIEDDQRGNATITAHLDTSVDTQRLTLPEVIHQLVRTAWDVASADPALARVEHELTLYALRTPEAAHLGRDLNNYHLDATEQIVDRTMEHTGHESPRPARELAHLINCVMDGILLDHLVNPDSALTDRSLANLSDAILALVSPPVRVG
ncbi:TetR/AcrR family transcriptional regulator [Nocardia sp. NPDC088792]|uniref:TetR/AcrR family transcriptional regulator n=1 Tax=Nocardia sp. NPDC088792 TaxID=3364332 RepID=UPI00380C0197